MATITRHPADPETIEQFRRAEEEQRFWDKHYRDLFDRYPEQFVAVRDGAVIVADADLFRFRELLDARGLTAQNVYIEFLTARPFRA